MKSLTTILRTVKTKIVKAKKRGLMGSYSLGGSALLFLFLCLQLISGEISCSNGRPGSSVNVMATREGNPMSYWSAIIFNLSLFILLLHQTYKKYFR